MHTEHMLKTKQLPESRLVQEAPERVARRNEVKKEESGSLQKSKIST